MYAIKNKELTASGQVTTKVAAGTNTLSAPARVLQLSIRCGSTLGRVDFIRFPKPPAKIRTYRTNMRMPGVRKR